MLRNIMLSIICLIISVSIVYGNTEADYKIIIPKEEIQVDLYGEGYTPCTQYVVIDSKVASDENILDLEVKLTSSNQGMEKILKKTDKKYQIIIKSDIFVLNYNINVYGENSDFVTLEDLDNEIGTITFETNSFNRWVIVEKNTNNPRYIPILLCVIFVIVMIKFIFRKRLAK